MDIVGVRGWRKAAVVIAEPARADQVPLIGLGNDRELWHGEDFRRALRNTVYYLVGYLPLVTVGGLGLALLVNQKLRGVALFRALYFLPVVTTWVVVSLRWKWLLNPGSGVVNWLLAKVGIEGDWLVDIPRVGDAIRHHRIGAARMVESRYCVADADGTPYRNRGWWFPGALLPDWTNPSAGDWWLAKRRYLLTDVGIDGFKTDGGEHAWGDELRYADGTRGEVSNNLFAQRYAEAYTALLDDSDVDGVTFSRAGLTGAGSAPCHWAGGQFMASGSDSPVSSIVTGASSAMRPTPSGNRCRSASCSNSASVCRWWWTTTSMPSSRLSNGLDRAATPPTSSQ